MIKKVLIQNFQSISKLLVEFKDFNVITAPSGTGKSAFTRALFSVFTNPRGSYFIKDNCSSCLVLIVTDKGAVSWEKSRTGSATYVVTLNGEEPQRFEKAQSYPDLARKVIDLTDIESDEVNFNLNLSPQGDLYYLIPPRWGSPTLVAKSIGMISGTDLVSKALNYCSKDIHGYKTTINSLEKMISAKELELARLGDKKLIDSILVACKKLKEQVSKLTLDIPSEDVRRAESIQRTIDLIPEVGVESIPKLPDIYESLASIDSISQILRKCSNLSEDVNSLGSEMEALVSKRNELKSEKEEFEKNNPMCPVCGQEWHKGGHNE